MEQKLQLCVFMLLIQVSLAVQRMTVKKGQTVSLSCPLLNSHQTSMEWRNPEENIMFFRFNKAEAVRVVRDKRYSIDKLSESEFTISISNVTFKDGGNYTCTQYDDHVIKETVELTVLDDPRAIRAKHEGRFDIKCTAEGNHYPPQIFWKLDDGPEIFAQAQVLHRGKTYVSKAMLSVQSVENRITVKCLVRHPALGSQHLMDFVKIGINSTKSNTWLTTAQPQGPTEVKRITNDWFIRGRTTVHLATRDVNGPSSESSAKSSTVPSNQLFSSKETKAVTAPTGFPQNPVTSTGSRVSTSDISRTSVSSGSTRGRNDTISNATSTTGWTSVSETTDEITSANSTEGNRTGIFNNKNMQTGTEGRSPLLVLLVTCLIFGLLVVVIFFAIKLRRAHITWKRENEESVPSEESSKSKSSQEEKNSQGQRRRGLFNTAFTKYDVEEPPVMTSVVNTAAMAAIESANKEQFSQPPSLGQTSANSVIKETEL